LHRFVTIIKHKSITLETKEQISP